MTLAGGASVSGAARLLAGELGLPRGRVYKAALALEQQMGRERQQQGRRRQLHGEQQPQGDGSADAVT